MCDIPRRHSPARINEHQRSNSTRGVSIFQHAREFLNSSEQFERIVTPTNSRELINSREQKLR